MMNKILLSSAVASGLAALTIGLAAPTFAAPAPSAPIHLGDTAQLNAPQAPKAPKVPRYYVDRDQYPYQGFGVAKHPYNNSLIPRPGQMQVPVGPIIGRR